MARTKKTPSPKKIIVKKPSTKGLNPKKIEKVMKEFKEGKMHSGKKTGPVVKSRKQAIAIALSVARKARKKKK